MRRSVVQEYRGIFGYSFRQIYRVLVAKLQRFIGSAVAGDKNRLPSNCAIGLQPWSRLAPVRNILYYRDSTCARTGVTSALGRGFEGGLGKCTAGTENLLARAGFDCGGLCILRDETWHESPGSTVTFIDVRSWSCF